jgi:hypothetical protein
VSEMEAYLRLQVALEVVDNQLTWDEATTKVLQEHRADEYLSKYIDFSLFDDIRRAPLSIASVEDIRRTFRL